MPHIYTTIEYLLGEEGRTERMLENHKGSSERLLVSSRVFQRVEVPSGRTFQGYSAFYGIPGATPS
jgi:hypothetical protein